MKSSPNAGARPATIRIAGQDVPIEERHVADLVVTSGRVIIADALMPSVTPLEVRVPPGRYPVTLSRVLVPKDEERNAFVTLRISRAPVAKWTWAEHEQRDGAVHPPREQDDGRPAFSVDSWHAGFMDVDARDALCEKFTQESDALAQEHEANDGTWNEHVFTTTRANVVSFFSGYGSGVYSAKVGRDASGLLVCVIVDFDLGDPPKSD